MKGLVICQQLIPAWLSGNKSITWRLMVPQLGMNSHVDMIDGRWVEWWDAELNGGYVDQNTREIWPRYLPGETVYIRESCYICGSDMDGAPLAEPPVVYRADGARKSDEYPHFRSPLFMPEWAARSHALIVSVRPEQIKSITPEEVKKEGLVVQDLAGVGVLALLGLTPETYMEQVAIMEFQSIWETLHPGSFERNDWVWRIELEKK